MTGSELEQLARENYCYLTTTGRQSNEPRTIEIWFGIDGQTLFMLSGLGRRAHWVKNILQKAAVALRIRDRTFAGSARLVDDGAEDALARRLLFEKYSDGYRGDLTDWARDALTVAVDIEVDVDVGSASIPTDPAR